MKSFFRLSTALGFAFCLGLSSCGRLSPGLSTNYGKVIATSDTEEEQGFTQSAYNEVSTPSASNTYGRVHAKARR